MNTNGPVDLTICPTCGATSAAALEWCQRCGNPMTLPNSESQRQPVAEMTDETPLTKAGLARGVRWTFSLRTMFLVTTIFAIYAAASARVPDLAIFLPMLALPALMRTIWEAKTQKEAGKHPAATQLTLVFLESVLLTLLIPFCCGVIFLVIMLVFATT
jgi:hypothetical protein